MGGGDDSKSRLERKEASKRKILLAEQQQQFPKLERRNTDTSIKNRSEEHKARLEANKAAAGEESPKPGRSERRPTEGSKKRLDRSRSRSKSHRFSKSVSDRRLLNNKDKDREDGETNNNKSYSKSSSDRRLANHNKEKEEGDNSNSRSGRTSRRKRIENSTRKERGTRGSSVEIRTRTITPSTTANDESRRSSRRGHSMGASRRRRENSVSERRRESRRRTGETTTPTSDKPRLDRTNSGFRALSEELKTRSVTPPPPMNRTLSQSEHIPSTSNRRNLSAKLKDGAGNRRNRRSTSSVGSNSHTMHSNTTLPTVLGDSEQTDFSSRQAEPISTRQSEFIKQQTRGSRRHRRRPSNTDQLQALVDRPILALEGSSSLELEEHSDILSLCSDSGAQMDLLTGLEELEQGPGPEKRTSGGRAKKALKMLKKTMLGSKKQDSAKHQQAMTEESAEDQT